MGCHRKAAHEAGHIVVAAGFGRIVGGVSIKDGDEYAELDRAMPPQFKAAAAVAGWLAEAMACGETFNTTTLYPAVEAAQRKSPDDYTDLSDAVDELIQAGHFSSRAMAVEEVWQRAESMLMLHAAAWQELTETIAKQESLDGADVRDLLRKHGMSPVEP